MVRAETLTECHFVLVHPKLKNWIFRLHNWFKTYINVKGGSQIGRLCLLVEFERGGSVTNGTTPCISFILIFPVDFPPG